MTESPVIVTMAPTPIDTLTVSLGVVFGIIGLAFLLLVVLVLVYLVYRRYYRKRNNDSRYVTLNVEL